MLLQGFACRVPGAAEGVLHLAGLSFSDSGLPQAWIGYKAADALFDRALQLVGNSLYQPPKRLTRNSTQRAGIMIP